MTGGAPLGTIGPEGSREDSAHVVTSCRPAYATVASPNTRRPLPGRCGGDLLIAHPARDERGDLQLMRAQRAPTYGAVAFAPIPGASCPAASPRALSLLRPSASAPAAALRALTTSVPGGQAASPLRAPHPMSEPRRHTRPPPQKYLDARRTHVLHFRP